jgi:hypothetical protein
VTDSTPPSAISTYELAAQMLREIVAGGPTRFARFGYGIDFSEDAPQFGTDDFATLMMDLAERVGIDLPSLGSQLNPYSGNAGTVGMAFRTVFEVEGHYVESPGAYTISRVPRDVVFTIGAVIVGLVTARTAHLQPEIAGTVSAVGSLLLNIISSRMTESRPPPLHWMEEFILRVVEEHGEVSYGQLKRYTKLHRTMLDTWIKALVQKELLRVDASAGTKSKTRYSLNEALAHRLLERK